MADEPIDNLVPPQPEPELPPQLPEEPVQDEQQQPGLIERAQNAKADVEEKIDQAKNLRDKFNELKEQFGSKKPNVSQVEKPGLGQTEDVAKQGGLRGEEEQIAKQAGRRVATQAGNLGNAGAQAVARTAATEVGAEAVAGAGVAAAVGAEAAAGPPGWVLAALTLLATFGGSIWKRVKKGGWKWIVYPIAIIFLLIAIPFALLAGQFLPTYPTTDAQRTQATSVAAVAGDPLATQQITATVISQEKAFYATLLIIVKAKLPGRASEFQVRVNEIIALMDQLVHLSLASSQPSLSPISGVGTALADTQDLKVGNFTLPNLKGGPRKTLLALILEKRIALAKDFPDIFFAAGGSCGDLAPFIYSGKFKIVGGSSGSNGKYILEGKSENKAHQFNPVSQELCQALLLGLRAGFKITALDTIDHDEKTAGGGLSSHWCGAALDISAINGHGVNGGNKDAEAISKLWYESSQNGQTYIRGLIIPSHYNKYGLFNNKPHKFKPYLQAIHEDHIHLSGRPAPGACPGRKPSA